MSRSRKKVPGHYWTIINHGVRKKEKKSYNRSWRRINKLLLKASPDNMLFNKHAEIIDVWSLAQDGNYLRTDLKKEPSEPKYYRK